MSDVLSILKQKAEQYKIPFEIVYSIVGLETGGTFDPSTIGDNGDSFGLFQINKPSHKNFDITRYTDPAYQADFQLPELKQYYDKGLSQGLQGVELAKYVEVYGQRPAYSDPNVKKYVDSAIPKYYNEIAKNITNTNTNLPSMNVGVVDKIITNLAEGTNTLWTSLILTLIIVLVLIMGGFSVYQIVK